MDNNPPKPGNTPQTVKQIQGEIIDGTTIKSNYKPNKHKTEIRRTVYQRFYLLRDDPLRAEAEKDWEMADQEYQMDFGQIDTTDWRSHLELPDAFAAIQAQMQETIERKARPYLCATEESDEPTADLANAVLEYNMNNTDFDYQYFLAKLSASIRGTSFLMCYWRTDKRRVKDPTGLNEDGTITYQEKEITDFDDDYCEWVANEFIYVDEKAKHISEATDMFRREIINIDEFHRIYGNKPGFYDTDYVVAGGDTSTRSFFQLPRDVNSQDVEVLHYYNRSIDAYWCVANNIAIFDGPLPTKHKELPLAVQYQYRVPGRFWGMGIPKVVHMLSEERKALRRLNLDRQKLNITGAFLHNSAFDVDDEDSQLVPGRWITVDTNGQDIRTAIQKLEFGDVPPSYFRSEEILLEDIKRAHGIDDRVQGVNVGGTATEAALLKESAMKRINMISITSEMDTILRIGRLKWSNIQFFYPVPRFEKIFEENKEKSKKVYKTVTIQGKKFSIVDDNGNKALKMDEIRGSSALNLDKSMAKYLEGSYDVSIESDIYTPPSKALHQTQMTQTLSLLLGNPLTASVIDPKKAVTWALKAVYEKADRLLPGEGLSDEDMQMLAEAENLILAAAQPLSPTEGATTAHTLVHLNYTKSAEFLTLPPQVQQLFELHIMGEDQANPATAGGPGQLSAPPSGPPPPGGNQNAMGQPGPSLNGPVGDGPTPQVADMQGANFSG
jgi:hypothetical protein